MFPPPPSLLSPATPEPSLHTGEIRCHRLSFARTLPAQLPSPSHVPPPSSEIRAASVTACLICLQLPKRCTAPGAPCPPPPGRAQPPPPAAPQVRDPADPREPLFGLPAILLHPGGGWGSASLRPPSRAWISRRGRGAASHEKAVGIAQLSTLVFLRSFSFSPTRLSPFSCARRSPLFLFYCGVHLDAERGRGRGRGGVKQLCSLFDPPPSYTAACTPHAPKPDAPWAALISDCYSWQHTHTRTHRGSAGGELRSPVTRWQSCHPLERKQRAVSSLPPLETQRQPRRRS